jgi:DNA-binding beta-propeller fold protein YncE
MKKRSAIFPFLALALTPFVCAPAQAAVSWPKFRYDPTWPKEMPNGYFFGQIAGMTTDSHGNIWVISRPRSIIPQLDEPPQEASGVPAPSVVEFDAKGKFLRGWGGPFAMSDSERAGFDWPVQEHGIAVDNHDNVWICGNGHDRKTGKDDNQCLKFTTDGKFLMQIGHSGQSKGSLDTENLNHAAWPVYYAPANELFIADGYVNRRVIVFDADTGKFKRMWGAYGKAPDDSVPRTRAYDPPPSQFNLVHGLTISKDGIVYVADRNNNRVQAFTLDGKFIKEGFVAHEIPMQGFGTVNSVALSADKDQRFVYICEGHQQRVRVLDRKTLTEIPQATFGHVGQYPGMFLGLHVIITDAKGNIFTGDGRNGQVLKFNFAGLAH